MIKTLLKFWGLHLVMIVVGMLVMGLNGGLQSLFSSRLADWVTLIVSLTVTAFYFTLFFRASRKMLRSLKEGLAAGLLAILPLLMVIAAALLYLQKVPYNTIGYGLMLLPVTLPFQGWFEAVFPALPFHVLALAVPAVLLAAVVAGSSMSASESQ
jgi:hypothetical protein